MSRVSLPRLLLLGGGHAHVGVLADLARRPLPGWQVQLLTPRPRQIYSGMLPGWLAGHYPIEACAIALDRLAAAASVDLQLGEATAMDAARQRVRCADGRELAYDLLSIDTGPLPALLPGLVEHALPVRPIEGFIAGWPALCERLRAAGQRLVVLGAGAAGVELAFALQYRAAAEGWPAPMITLVGADEQPLAGAPAALRRRVLQSMAVRGVGWAGGRRALRLEASAIHFESGAPLHFDACLAATGAAAPGWPATGGLATDEVGFIRVAPTLQSLSHAQVFAAGDVAAYADARPKSGVFAVRAAPVLAHNLRAACGGQPLQSWTPQKRALYLISTGERHALASWGRWSWGGRWVWRWKDRIDRRFIARYAGADAV